MPRDTEFYDALPRLEIDGAEDAMAAGLLEAMEMTESTGGLSSLELCFVNAAAVDGRPGDMPFETDANAKLSLGAEIRLVAGDTHDPQEVFQGKISGLELVLDGAAPPKLIVLAEDALAAARMARRTKLHEVATLDDLVSAVARESGLQVVSAGLTQPLSPKMQANETDLGFLRRVCARFDVDFQVVGKTLQISPRSAVDRGVLTYTFGETLTAFRGLADLNGQVSDVTLAGWDHTAHQAFAVTSQTADDGPGAGRKGAEYVEEAFFRRTEHVAEAAPTDQAEAQALADAILAARQRRFVSVEGTVTGDPALRVGTVVEIDGVGDRFTNSYYVTHAQHRFRKGTGYFTDFRAECAFFNG